MSKQNKENATCIICGKPYHLCIACERTKSNWKQWKMITDNENCYEIYNVLNDYNYNKISKDEARSLLEKLDLKDVDSFKESVKKIIKEIMENKKTTRVKKTEKVEEKITEENVEVVETVEEKSLEDLN